MSAIRKDIIIFFLFVSLIIGVFASVAQNDYGMQIIGYACFGFALLCFYQAIYITGIPASQHSLSVRRVENATLGLIFLLFGFRAFFIWLPQGETIFLLATAVLTICYIYYLSVLWKMYKESRSLKLGVTSLYLAICLFLASLTIAQHSTSISFVFGVSAFVIALGFFTYFGIFRPQTIFNLETVKVIPELFSFKTNARLLVIMLLGISIFMGLNQAKLIPSLYAGNQPSKYLELITLAESGVDQRVDGKYQHERYIDAYNHFIQNRKEDSSKIE